MNINKRIILLLTAVICTTGINLYAQEHIWLHVDGKNIRTSPQANPPDSVFIPVGVSYTDNGWDSSNYSCSLSTSYILDRQVQGINFIRYPFYFEARTNYSYFDSAVDINRLINNTINSAVSRCKINNMYIILDDHEYFHNTGNYWPFPGWLPAGDPWSDQQFQNWINYWKAIATRYKDEPWVMGYELQNEPYSRFDGDLTTEQIRYWLTQCVQAIRTVDKRHIIFLGNSYFDTPGSMIQTWEPVGFRPDEPYNQVVFPFHIYPIPGAEDCYGFLRAGPQIDYVRDNHRAAVICTETAPAEGAGYPNEIRLDFWKTILPLFKYRNIPWNLWFQVQGEESYDYPIIWEPYAMSMRSAIPQPGSAPGTAFKVLCSADKGSISGDFNNVSSTTFVEARVVDDNDVTIMSSYTFTFDISGPGVILTEDGAQTSQDVSGYYGTKAVKICTTGNPGTINITATVDGLGSASAEITVPVVNLTGEYTTDWRPPVSTKLRGPSSSMTVGKSTATTVLGVNVSNIKSAMLRLVAFDVDSVSEMAIYINGNGPIYPPSSIVGDDQYKESYITISTGVLVSGNNTVRFEYRGGESPKSYYNPEIPGNVQLYVGFNIESTKILTTYLGDVQAPSLTSLNSYKTTTYTETLIHWDTNEPATSLVLYGTTTALGNSSVYGPDEYQQNHDIILTGLSGQSTYYYLVKTQDNSGNLTISVSTNSFVTSAPPDLTPPVISRVTLSTINDNMAVIYCQTDEGTRRQIALGTYTVYNISEGTKTAYSLYSGMTLNYSQLYSGVTITGLKEGTEYHFQVRATDRSGNLYISTGTNVALQNVPHVFTTTKNGEPVGLLITPGSLSLGNIQKGEVKTVNINISKVPGSNEVSGTVKLDDNSWVTLSTNAFTGDSLITMTVDSSLLPENRKYNTVFSVLSNKGSKQMPLSVVLVTPFAITAYPNPFTAETSFLLILDKDSDVEIRIFTASGRLIRSIKTSGKYGSNIIAWDGKDSAGNDIGPGVYLYKLRCTSDGSKTEKFGKILKTVKSK